MARERVHELVFQNPRLAFYLVGLIAGRLVDDLKIIEQRVSANLAVDRSAGVTRDASLNVSSRFALSARVPIGCADVQQHRRMAT